MLTTTQKRRVRLFTDMMTKAVISGADYAGTIKHKFKTDGRWLLRLIANELGLEPTQYDLRWNAGGIAVSGEVTLHADGLYIQFYQSGFSRSESFLVRTCNGRKDYTGGPNRWIPWYNLLNFPKAVADIRAIAFNEDGTFRGTNQVKIQPITA